MAEEAAPNPSASGAQTLDASKRTIVARVRSELPAESKWPIAWRLLFLVSSAAVLWFLFVAMLRLL